MNILTTQPAAKPAPRLAHRVGMFALSGDSDGTTPMPAEVLLAEFLETHRRDGYAVMDGPRLIDLRGLGPALYVMLTHQATLLENDLMTVSRQIRAQKEMQSLASPGVLSAVVPR